MLSMKEAQEVMRVDPGDLLSPSMVLEGSNEVLIDRFTGKKLGYMTFLEVKMGFLKIVAKFWHN